MDPHVKNLREWLGLLLLLFCVLDIAGLQYGIMLAQDAPLHPNPVVGQIVSMVRGPKGAWYNVYITARQFWIFHAFLAAAALSMITMLGLIVGHGVHQVRATRNAVKSYQRKR